MLPRPASPAPPSSPPQKPWSTHSDLAQTGSESLSASIRCGYVAAHPDYVSALRDLQVATGFGGPSPISAELVVGVLGDGTYRRHLEALRPRLAKARREVTTKLLALGIEPWIMPRGGFYLWCCLPPGIDAAALTQTALHEGVVLAPGNVFSLSQTASGFMRFNVVQMGELERSGGLT